MELFPKWELEDALRAIQSLTSKREKSLQRSHLGNNPRSYISFGRQAA